jgi:hypothetical protein
LLQHTQDDLQSSLDTYPFEDADLFHEDFHSLCSDFDRHQVMASPKQIKVRTTKQKYFHVEIFAYKEVMFPNLKRRSFSLDLRLCLTCVSPCLGNHGFSWDLSSFLILRSSDFLSEDEDDPSSTYGIPLQRWIDQACGYTLGRMMADGFSFKQDFLPPTHLHEFYFMIDYMCVYTHDYYVLDLSLLYYMIKHRGRYFDEMIKWLHWLYDFT